MENRIEKKMENKMESGMCMYIYICRYRVI